MTTDHIDGLPRWNTVFLGRDVERADTAALLTDRRVLTLTGAGGCGKTRLAPELARKVAGQFAAAVFVDLSPLPEGSEVVDAVRRMDSTPTPCRRWSRSVAESTASPWPSNSPRRVAAP